MNPLVNRIADIEELVAVCAGEIGVRRVQMTNEFINPSWPAAAVARLAATFNKAASAHGLEATSAMTGLYARISNLGHPDGDVRDWTVAWMIRFAEIAADIGAPALGSQFAILPHAENDDPDRRDRAILAALDCWERIWAGAEKAGLTYVYWEQMSIGREFGHTIADAEDIQSRIAKRGIPMKILLDVDHGDVSSENPRDTDPYAWIAALGADCPIMHLKQSTANKGGFWPFIEPYNSEGRIDPARLIGAMSEVRDAPTELCLELGFREREPSDRLAVDHLKRSVEYWRPHVAS
ncbi:MAG: aminotransferase [Maritimibacter sp.]|nr:aminotransferase [Maritimibacter sp.]